MEKRKLLNAEIAEKSQSAQRESKAILQFSAISGFSQRALRLRAFQLQTPTGNGLEWFSEAPKANPAKRPCSNDIKPVYQ